MLVRLVSFVLLSLSLSMLGAGPVLASVGKALEVQGGATLISSGKSQKLTAGMLLDNGDEVRTDAKGQVQLEFNDSTKIAVGPNSRMRVDDIVMRNKTRASKFAVSAVKGSFRFISGKSAKPAYSIDTPSATLGIRGTVFDFAVDRRSNTALALFRGEVFMCGRQNSCARVRGRCSLVEADIRGDFFVPETRDQAFQTIQQNFPFILSQETLRRQFRTNVDSCDKHTRLPVVPKADRKKFTPVKQVPTPPPPPPPPLPLPPPLPPPCI